MTDTQEPPEQPAEVEPDIAEFLLARIDDDEKAAQVCQAETALPAAWMALHEMTTDPPASIRMAFKHAIRHDPARILAECDAKRRMVEMHEREAFWDRAAACSEDGKTFPCETLRLLALAYDDYPGYDEGWRL